MKTNENKHILKRIAAFILDILIVTTIATLFANYSVINPNIDKYESVYQNYMNYIQSVSNINDLLNVSDILNKYSYDIAYYSVVTSLITLIITILYFVVFQYFNKGRTIGKAIFKFKVVDKNDKNPSIISFLIRSLIINSILTSLFNCILIVYFSRDSYSEYSMYIEYIDMALLFISFGMVLLRNDGRGLHDIISGTSVKYLDNSVKFTIKEKNKKIED